MEGKENVEQFVERAEDMESMESAELNDQNSKGFGVERRIAMPPRTYAETQKSNTKTSRKRQARETEGKTEKQSQSHLEKPKTKKTNKGQKSLKTKANTRPFASRGVASELPIAD